MNNNFKGVIIKESLADKSITDDLKIISTKIENVSAKHKTPWINKWTLYTVKITLDEADQIADKLSRALDSEHAWYADFKNNDIHYIIFKNKIFKINRSKKEEYNQATKYGISLGIPDYQLNFSADIKMKK